MSIKLPNSIGQNPSLPDKDSLERKTRIYDQTDRIMSVFSQLVPSNYVSSVEGPFYRNQFYSLALKLAEYQIEAQELYSDNGLDFTRTDFLYQLLGSYIFPEGATSGIPVMPGDVTYRDFLVKLLSVLLKGATKEALQQGLSALDPDLVFDLQERKGIKDQHKFEVFVSSLVDGSYRFAQDPFVLQTNVLLVLKALKPAHTKYEYSNLFEETMPEMEDSFTMDYNNHYYEDFRVWSVGPKQIQGTTGQTFTDRRLFSDPSRDFSNVPIGSELHILSGDNETQLVSTLFGVKGSFRIEEVRVFPVGDDSTPRAYITSPTGLEGRAVVQSGVIIDLEQDFGSCVEGEVFSFTEGPNQGDYRLKYLTGNNGGLVGFVEGPSTGVIPAPCLLKLDRRMKKAATGQSYKIILQRLGVQEVHFEEREDVSNQFYN